VAARLFTFVWILVLVAAAGSSGHVGASGLQAPRFRVLAHVDPGGGYSGDVVGERHFAYLSSRRGKTDCPAQGVRVYNLANPRRPRHVSTFAALKDTWTEKTIVRRVKTSGFDGVLAVSSFQACTNGAFGGFGVYDVTKPSRPRRLALVRTVPRGSHEIWLATARGHAWVYTAEAAAEFALAPDSFGFHIYDVSSPRKPVEVGGWSACRELHECTPLNRGIDQPAYLVHSVITNAAATRAYLSYWDLGTVILDITDPGHIAYLGRTAPGQGKVHSAWLTGGGKIMLETHEVAHGRPVVWQIADPAHPVQLSTVRLPAALRPGGSSAFELADSVHDPKVLGRYAYFSWYGQGVALFDLRNPAKPRFVTRFRPPPKRDGHELLCPGEACTAVWGVFPTPNYVLASDLNSGLWVLSRPA
jgi:hypothetical protein